MMRRLTSRITSTVRSAKRSSDAYAANLSASGGGMGGPPVGEGIVAWNAAGAPRIVCMSDGHFNFARDVIERHWAVQRPEGLALWWVDETGARERRLTFRQLTVEMRRAATCFDSLGIKAGDRVLVML